MVYYDVTSYNIMEAMRRQIQSCSVIDDLFCFRHIVSAPLATLFHCTQGIHIIEHNIT